MLTSLAPSPIAKVVILSSSLGFLGSIFLINVTISAFCFGETRHAITTFCKIARLMNSLRSLGFDVILESCSPSTTKAVSLYYPIIFFLTWKLQSYKKISYVVLVSTMKISVSLESNAQLKPMLMAVSTLSPVSTHNFIVALLIKLITSATLSCNLSSIAVLPISSKSISIFSAT